MGISEDKLKDLISIFKTVSEVKLVYLFGSQAGGEVSPLSDYDFAVYLDTKDKKRMYEIRFELFDKISRLLKTDRIDIVILNLTGSPDLKYMIIKYGRLILERVPFKVIVGPGIMNEYFDLQKLLMRYHHTEAEA